MDFWKSILTSEDETKTVNIDTYCIEPNYVLKLDPEFNKYSGTHAMALAIIHIPFLFFPTKIEVNNNTKTDAILMLKGKIKGKIKGHIDTVENYDGFDIIKSDGECYILLLKDIKDEKLKIDILIGAITTHNWKTIKILCDDVPYEDLILLIFICYVKKNGSIKAVYLSGNDPLLTQLLYICKRAFSVYVDYKTFNNMPDGFYNVNFFMNSTVRRSLHPYDDSNKTIKDCVLKFLGFIVARKLKKITKEDYINALEEKENSIFKNTSMIPKVDDDKNFNLTDTVYSPLLENLISLFSHKGDYKRGFELKDIHTVIKYTEDEKKSHLFFYVENTPILNQVDKYVITSIISKSIENIYMTYVYLWDRKGKAYEIRCASKNIDVDENTIKKNAVAVLYILSDIIID
jgi:hypothetical protein